MSVSAVAIEYVAPDPKGLRPMAPATKLYLPCLRMMSANPEFDWTPAALEAVVGGSRVTIKRALIRAHARGEVEPVAMTSTREIVWRFVRLKNITRGHKEYHSPDDPEVYPYPEGETSPEERKARMKKSRTSVVDNARKALPTIQRLLHARGPLTGGAIGKVLGWSQSQQFRYLEFLVGDGDLRYDGTLYRLTTIQAPRAEDMTRTQARHVEQTRQHFRLHRVDTGWGTAMALDITREAADWALAYLYGQGLLLVRWVGNLAIYYRNGETI